MTDGAGVPVPRAAMDGERCGEVRAPASRRRVPYCRSLLLPRIWELRDSLTAYDAAYLAAAEHCDAPLVTRDKELLAHAGRARCPIHAIGPVA
ncbi:hypothetical protein [Frankia sp. Cas3]|uniref:hypothetical protein n=1 Tax=Frankia sp. Cas3 TaxID=3073926 RepID=UPI002AD284A0|nr:hypothetical protein [Frankia sp. Cas3]